MKKKLIIVLFSLIVLFLIILCLMYRKETIPVLGYHSFYKDKSELIEKNDEYINNINDFEKQMKYLSDHNYKSLTLDEFYCWKKNKCKFPRKSVVVTIDDGNLSNLMYAFDVLKKYNINASVFYIGYNAKIAHGKVIGKNYNTIYDYMSLSQIEKAKKDYPNIKFYSHSYNLHIKSIKEYTDDEIINDVKEMNKIEPFKYYAHPFGTYDERIIKELKNNNYKMAFGFGPNKEFRKATKEDDDYHISRLNISNYVSFTKFKIRLLMPY